MRDSLFYQVQCGNTLAEHSSDSVAQMLRSFRYSQSIRKTKMSTSPSPSRRKGRSRSKNTDSSPSPDNKFSKLI